jgi:hypothetical protein
VDKKKAPEENGITGEIDIQTFEFFPRFLTPKYNGCLRGGVYQRGGKEQHKLQL